MVAFKWYELEAIILSIHEQQLASQPVSTPHNVLEHVLCNDGTDDAGSGTENAARSLLACHGSSRRFGVQAAEAGCCSRDDRECHYVEVDYRTDKQRFVKKDSSVGNEISRTVVVCGVDDHVVGAKESIGVVWIQSTGIGLDMYVRVQCHQPFLCDKGLGLTDVSCGIEYLPIQVGQAHGVSIDYSYRTHSSGSQAQQDRGAESSGSHDQNRLFCQLPLSSRALRTSTMDETGRPSGTGEADKSIRSGRRSRRTRLSDPAVPGCRWSGYDRGGRRRHCESVQPESAGTLFHGRHRSTQGPCHKGTVGGTEPGHTYRGLSQSTGSGQRLCSFQRLRHG